MKRKCRRLFAVLLAAVTITAGMPASVLAAEPTDLAKGQQIETSINTDAADESADNQNLNAAADAAGEVSQEAADEQVQERDASDEGTVENNGKEDVSEEDTDSKDLEKTDEAEELTLNKEETSAKKDEGVSAQAATQYVNLVVGQTTTVTDETGKYASAISTFDKAVAEVTAEDEDKAVLSDTQVTAAKLVSGNSYHIGDGNGNYLTLENGSLVNTTDVSKAVTWKMTVSGSKYRIGCTEGSTTYYLRYRNGSLNVTTRVNQSTLWSCDDSKGLYYKSNSNEYYIYLNSSKNWTASSTATTSDYATPREVTSSSLAATVITFTGIAVGTTAVTIGNTTYEINVSEAPVSQHKLKGSTEGGAEQVVTKLTTSIGVSYTLNLDPVLKTGQTVAWTSEDSRIAAVDNEGEITGVLAGTTKITATVYNKNGKAISVNEIPVTVLTGSGSTSGRLVHIYISEILNTTVYYSLNCGTNMTEVQEGEVIYARFSSSQYTFFDFFGDPDEGYALTQMSSTNSAGDYMSLHKDGVAVTDDTTTEDGELVYFYNQVAAAGKNQRGIAGNEPVANMVKAAVRLGCDGGLGFTRPVNDGDIKSNLTFRSRRLPTIEKSILTVAGEPYEEGMTAKAGDVIEFLVTVQKYGEGEITYNEKKQEWIAEEEITYSNVLLNDTLPGAIFKGTSVSEKSITSAINDAGISEKEYSYYVTYSVKASDLDKTIKNTIELTYKYKSRYSSGSFGGSANAEAKITATTFNPEPIVVDFGLPVVLDYSASDAHGKYDLSAVTSTTGEADVRVDENKIIYTPKQILTKKDTLTITNTEGGVYTVDVYPATSVYYEEGFAAFTGNWTPAFKGSKTQTWSTVGSKALYGYDASYANETANSAGNAASGAEGSEAEFTFNGTGCDIYALTTNTSGAMTTWLYDEKGNLLKLGYVETANDYLEGNRGSYYNTPVFSYQGLEVGTYKVKMQVYSGTVSLDGYRVYNTQGAAYDEAVYTKDQEADAQVVEVRDITIAGVDYNIDDIDDWYTYGDNIISAVYNATNNGAGAVIFDNDKSDVAVDTGMINNGPKNEIYLEPGQTIAIGIEGRYADVALGMRSLNGGKVSYNLGSGSQSLSSTVDMYYSVKSGIKDGVLTVKNTGTTGVIALTKLKVTEFSGTEGNSGDVEENMVLTAAKYASVLMRISTMEMVKTDSEITLKNKTAAYSGKAISIDAAEVTGSTGAVTYVYYTDKNCTKKTTAANGASAAGMAPKNAGTYYVKAAVAEDDVYLSAESNIAVLKITKKNAALKFKTSAVSKTYGAGTFTNALTKSTDGEITFKSSNSAVASVNKTTGKVTVKGSGKVTITASASAGTNYNAASKSYTLNVKPGKAKISSAKNSAKKTITVKWSKGMALGQNLSNASYKVEYSTSKKFTSKTTKAKTVKAAQTSVKLTGLKKGTTYYVRIKAYNKTLKKYGAVSAVKQVKIKK